jgi:hypothetical protein
MFIISRLIWREDFGKFFRAARSRYGAGKAQSFHDSLALVADASRGHQQ